MKPSPGETPSQPVERPILCRPYAAPPQHWHYDRATCEATKMTGRRPSRDGYRPKDQPAGQKMLELVEGQEGCAEPGATNRRTAAAQFTGRVS